MKPYLGAAESTTPLSSPGKSKKERNFLDITLCALAFGATVDERMNHILSYCAVEIGEKLWKKNGEQAVEVMVFGNIGARGKTPEDFDESSKQHIRAMAGLITLKVPERNMQKTLSEHAALKAHVEAFHRKHGKDATARVRADIFRDALSGELDYKTFAVFAAILSDVGKKDWRYVYREVIQHRALGYRTKEIMGAELPSRADGASPLAIHKISYQTTHVLQPRKLIAKVRINDRQNVISVRLSQSQLEAALLKHESERLRRTASEPQEFRARLRAVRAGRTALAA